MGRIGKRALEIPAGVAVKIDGGRIEVKGPKGTLVLVLRPQVTVKIEENKLLTVCATDDRTALAMHGMYNALIKNMLTGVTAGFQKDLDLPAVDLDLDPGRYF